MSEGGCASAASGDLRSGAPHTILSYPILLLLLIYSWKFLLILTCLKIKRWVLVSMDRNLSVEDKAVRCNLRIGTWSWHGYVFIFQKSRISSYRIKTDSWIDGHACLKAMCFYWLWDGPLFTGGGWSYIFRTLNSIPFFPDKSRYHRIFTLSGLFRTCQAPDSAAEVDPVAHFGHFRSHLYIYTCTW